MGRQTKDTEVLRQHHHCYLFFPPSLLSQHHTTQRRTITPSCTQTNRTAPPKLCAYVQYKIRRIDLHVGSVSCIRSGSANYNVDIFSRHSMTWHGITQNQHTKERIPPAPAHPAHFGTLAKCTSTTVANCAQAQHAASRPPTNQPLCHVIQS